MWIWIICLIVLIVCFVIAWRMMMNSYDLLPSEKKFSLFQSFSPSDISYHLETLRSMKSKMKSLEDKSDYMESQLEKLNQKLKGAEKGDTQGTFSPFPKANAVKQDEEDWKELYYEENSKKEKLENDLDIAQQEIEFLRESLNKNNHRSDETSVLQNEYDLRLQDIQSLQEEIKNLQQRLSNTGMQNNELRLQLEKETQQRKQHEEARNQAITLKSENEGLRRQITEMGMRQSEIEGKLIYMNELEKKVTLYEEEKSKMIADLEMMLNQNREHNQ